MSKVQASPRSDSTARSSSAADLGRSQRPNARNSRSFCGAPVSAGSSPTTSGRAIEPSQMMILRFFSAIRASYFEMRCCASESALRISWLSASIFPFWRTSQRTESRVAPSAPMTSEEMATSDEENSLTAAGACCWASAVPANAARVLPDRRAGMRERFRLFDREDMRRTCEAFPPSPRESEARPSQQQAAPSAGFCSFTAIPGLSPSFAASRQDIPHRPCPKQERIDA